LTITFERPASVVLGGAALHGGFYPISGYDGALQRMTRWANCGRQRANFRICIAGLAQTADVARAWEAGIHI